MTLLHVLFCSVSVRETDIWLTCSVRFGQNGKTLLRSVTTGNQQWSGILFLFFQNYSDWLQEKVVLLISKSFQILGLQPRISYCFSQSLEHYIWKVKRHYNFWNRMLFLKLIPGSFSDLINYTVGKILPGIQKQDDI